MTLELDQRGSELMALSLLLCPNQVSHISQSSFVPTTLRAHKVFKIPADSQALYSTPISMEYGAVIDIGYNSVLEQV